MSPRAVRRSLSRTLRTVNCAVRTRLGISAKAPASRSGMRVCQRGRQAVLRGRYASSFRHSTFDTRHSAVGMSPRDVRRSLSRTLRTVNCAMRTRLGISAKAPASRSGRRVCQRGRQAVLRGRYASSFRHSTFATRHSAVGMVPRAVRRSIVPNAR